MNLTIMIKRVTPELFVGPVMFGLTAFLVQKRQKIHDPSVIYALSNAFKRVLMLWGQELWLFHKTSISML